MGKKNRMKGSSGIVKVKFTALTALAAASNIKVISLATGFVGATTVSPGVGSSFSNRLSSMAAAFSMFRFTKVKLICSPFTSAYAVGYVPNGGGITSPASIQATMDQLYSLYMSGNMMVSKNLIVPKSALRGEFPWYRCDSTVDASESTQGYFFVFTTGATDAIPITVQGEIEYKGSTNSNIALTLIDEEFERKVIARYLQRKDIPSSSLTVK